MITEKAYAKINLSLDITGKLPDGYHSLETVMQTVTLYDDVTVRKSGGISVSCGELSGENNLAFKAAKAFFAHTGIAGGAEINITKRIPVCGGFGGGSADAAAVLRALDTLYGTALCHDTLCAIALTLGADVPFLIRGGTALCTGKGELMTPVECRAPLYYCLCAPHEGASTAEMFARADGLGIYGRHGVSMADALRSGDVNAVAYLLHNDFTDICASFCPSTVFLRAALTGCGALASSLTGSGSGCFGVFADLLCAENAARVIGAECFACAAAPALT